MKASHHSTLEFNIRLCLLKDVSWMDINYETMVSTNSDFSREPLVPVPRKNLKLKETLVPVQGSFCIC
jgi:hypothetical protein